MTANVSSTGPVEREPSADQDDARRALADYNAAMRHARARYFVAIAVGVAAVTVWVAVAWSRGEITHTTLRTAATPAPSISQQVPGGVLKLAWTSTDHTAAGAPYWGGTMVTYDAHSVRGRNAITGAVTWSYTRSDRTVCEALQNQGVTIAVYELKGNCDEVTTLNSGTGVREWTRTLDENGQPIFGRPVFQVTDDTFMVTTPSVIYAIQASTGIDRWVFGQQNCTIRHALLGSAGALISQTCDHPSCQGLTYCHAGPQLLLRNPFNAYNDDTADQANPDQITWNLAGNTSAPAAADNVVAAFGPRPGELTVFAPANGKTRATVALTPPPGPVSNTASVTTSGGELIWGGGVGYLLSSSARAVMWSARSTAPPTLLSTATDPATGLPELAAALITVPTTTGIALLAPQTGLVGEGFAVTAPPAGSMVYPLGPGFVVAGPRTTVYR